MVGLPAVSTSKQRTLGLAAAVLSTKRLSRMALDGSVRSRKNGKAGGSRPNGTDRRVGDELGECIAQSTKGTSLTCVL